MYLWCSLCTLKLLACEVSYRRRLRCLLLCLCDVFWAVINSLVCWFFKGIKTRYPRAFLACGSCCQDSLSGHCLVLSTEPCGWTCQDCGSFYCCVRWWALSCTPSTARATRCSSGWSSLQIRSECLGKYLFTSRFSAWFLNSGLNAWWNIYIHPNFLPYF